MTPQVCTTASTDLGMSPTPCPFQITLMAAFISPAESNHDELLIPHVFRAPPCVSIFLRSTLLCYSPPRISLSFRPLIIIPNPTIPHGQLFPVNRYPALTRIYTCDPTCFVSVLCTYRIHVSPSSLCLGFFFPGFFATHTCAYYVTPNVYALYPPYLCGMVSFVFSLDLLFRISWTLPAPRLQSKYAPARDHEYCSKRLHS